VLKQGNLGKKKGREGTRNMENERIEETIKCGESSHKGKV
jgi:hypothetical protein